MLEVLVAPRHRQDEQPQGDDRADRRHVVHQEVQVREVHETAWNYLTLIDIGEQAARRDRGDPRHQ